MPNDLVPADPVKLYRTMRVFADARDRRLRRIALGQHVCPPFPERCTECTGAVTRGS
jgi:hypothetical protein